MNRAEILEGREKGQFPLSVATSLALEGAFGILEEKPVKPAPIMEYQELWVNLRTLFRNLYGSMKKEDALRLLPEDYAEAVREEIAIIQGILAQRTGHGVQAVFYANDYNSLSKLYPYGLFKEVKTVNQKHYAGLENNMIDGLFKLLKETDVPLYRFDTNLTGHGKNALMLSHYPLDLIANNNFKEIGLLESHTGALKKPHQWYTKLNGGKDLVRIPFNRMTIQLFGDSGGLFAPYPSQYKQAVLDVAERYKWNTATTKDRIMLTVDSLKMPTLSSAIRKLWF